MINNATNINERVCVPVPSQYLVFQRYMPCSLLWSVMLRSEVIVCFVNIDGIVEHHSLNLHFIITSHIELLNIKRIIALTYSYIVSYNTGNWKEFDTYRRKRLGKLLNVSAWIDVIWFLFTWLQNIKYVLNTMINRVLFHK